MLFQIRSEESNKKKLPLQPDEELIKAYKKSLKSEYIGILFERYSHLVYGVCLKYMKDEDKSKDAVMQIFESLHSKLIEFEITSFKSWLHTVSRNHCLMALRKEKSERIHLENLYKISGGDIMESDEFIHLFEDDHREEIISLLEEAIGQLNEEQKTCIELFYLRNKSYREVSEITGYDMNKVKSHIQNGKRNLRILLERK